MDEEVFGFKRKQATVEQRRQKEFSDRQLQAIQEQAAREVIGEQDTDCQQAESGQQARGGGGD